MGYKKDYAAILSAAWDIDRAYDRVLREPDFDTVQIAQEMGLREIPDEEAQERREKLIRMLLDNAGKSPFVDRYIDPAFRGNW